MRQWIAAAGMIAISMSGCNMQNALTENQQPQRVKLTMQEVIPPMAPATPEAVAEQNKFLEQNVSRFKSRKLASAYYVQQAKRTFNERKPDSAMVYFNRAWLMDRSNNEIYWGYGLVYGHKAQYDKALYILYRALDKDKENTRLLTDVATTHLARYYQQSNPNDLHQSKKLLERALKLNSDNAADTFYKLAVNSYYLLEFGQAWDYLHQSIRQDRGKEDKTFIAALLQHERDPQGVYTRQEVQ
ncbi:tetratricopeptide repeat protein [Pontibacter anaerobius]|uniref:Tetratricopeptide repeat protein n=1 Tax=Pontibacter anaerobius TaxID=2993940 RepID=A0ABT3RC20_9BACT|nr:hypothetical protein [Pontibacter anaerobius]MCX2739397.1 hypothetical protein [Pontibacter anaerobius]